MTLTLGFPRLTEAAAANIEPADPRSGPGPDWGDSLLGADVSQPAGQDWRLREPSSGRSRLFDTGIVTLQAAHVCLASWTCRGPN